MSKVCPSCREVVEDEERMFCPYCGNPFDSNLKLTMDMDKMVREQKAANPLGSKGRREETRPTPTRSRYDDDDDDYIPTTHHEEKKSSMGIIVVVLIIIIAVCIYFYLKK